MDVLTLAFLTGLLLLGVVGTLAWLSYRSLRTVEELVVDLRQQALATPPVQPAENNDVSALRLQACERFTLMTERIAVQNLLLRLAPKKNASAKEYVATLLLTIREEFEYNVTQQIYVSDSLWNVLLQARDNVSQLIVRAGEDAEGAEQVASRLRVMSAGQPRDPIALAQAAIRREAVQLVSAGQL